MRERSFVVPELPTYQVQTGCEYDIREENCEFEVEREAALVVPSTPAADDAVKG